MCLSSASTGTSLPSSGVRPSSSAGTRSGFLDSFLVDVGQKAKAAEERKQADDHTPDAIIAFGRKYFPHYCYLPPGRFHRELCADLQRILDSPNSERFDVAAPRGNAKSTWINTIFTIYCIAKGLKRFIILIGSTAENANEELQKVKHELEENEALARDYPHICGRGRMWRQNEIITTSDVKVLALGAGKRIRGRKHRHFRPDLVVVDDLETDEHVRNLEQRKKVENWLTKAVLKAGGPGQKFDVIVVGTILHFDSVLARLQDQRRFPGWTSRKYQSVIRWSERKELWAVWEQLYTDFSKPDGVRQAAADRFLIENREAMLEGTEVLWPEAEPYELLMRMRIDDGPASFDSEKQNEPINPEDCLFREEWFRWFDEVEIDGEIWLLEEKGERIRLADCDIHGACDPSMGKKNKHNDPSAIVSIAAYPSKRLWDQMGCEAYRSYWIIDADVRKRHPHQIILDILEMHGLRHYHRFGVESVQFQELFAENVLEAALGKQGLQDLRIDKLTPLGDKGLRIEKLQPFIYAGRLKWCRKITVAYNQTRFYPQSDHDDGPDAIEMAMETLGAIGWHMINSVMPERKNLSEEEEKIRELYPDAFEEFEGTCGNCVNMGEKNGRGWCKVQNFYVKPTQESCRLWEEKE